MRALPELVPRIPGPARAVVRSAVWTYGRATAGVRPLPDFLVIGAQRAGTTALYAYLRAHPAIMGPSWKEVSFFDRHHARGEAWYRGHFPNALRRRLVEHRTGASPLVGEASPGYLFHPHAPARVAGLLPGARLVALLRDPVERAFSHYRFEVALGREPLPFDEALEREEERLAADPEPFGFAWRNHTYLARGRYAEQLERWLAHVPRERLLVVASEELFAEPARTYGRVLEFLGAPPHAARDYARRNAAPARGLEPRVRNRLAEYYAEPNRRLYDLLGRDLGWTTSAGR